MPGNTQLTSGQFWLYALVMVVVDAAFMLLLARRIQPGHFRKLRWPLTGTAALFWSIFGLALVWIFWDSYYRYFYPAWFRSGGILVFVPVVFGMLALAFHWLALKLPGNPLLNFCILAGLESVLEHLVGIYGLKVIQVPMLQGASPVSVLAFAFPEYIFYCCIVISIAAIFQAACQWWKRRFLPLPPREKTPEDEAGLSQCHDYYVIGA
jgi:hypothetical protein